MEIQVPAWDTHSIVAGLNQLIGSQNMYLVISSAQNMWTIIVNAHVKNDYSRPHRPSPLP
jgi:hypothetical protein